MSGRFLKLSEDALDESKAGERLILCRKAAEAFCKEISPEPMPEKVEGNLSRMIDFLSSRKLIDSNQAISLQIIRMWANNQSHDNPTNDLALPQSLENLKKLREWYEKTYIEKEDVNHSSFSNIKSDHVRFKYYYEAHKNLKDSWFDGAKKYRLLGLSEEVLLEEWRKFRLRYLIGLQEIEEIVEREEVSRELIVLVLSLDDSHICEIDSLWENDKLISKLRNWIYFNESWFDIKKRYRMLRLTEDDLLKEWHKFRVSNLVTHFKFQEQIDKEKDSLEKMRLVLSLDDKYICRIDSIVRGGHLKENLKPQIISNILALFQNDGQVLRFSLGSDNTVPLIRLLKICEDFHINSKNLQNKEFLLEVPSEFHTEPETSICSLIYSLKSVFSTQKLALCTNLKDCETFAIGLYGDLQEEFSSEPDEWPIVFPSGAPDFEAYKNIVDEIYRFEGDKLVINFPSDLYQLIIMARAASDIGTVSQIIVELDSLEKDSFNEEILDWAMGEVMNNIFSSYSLVSVISKFPNPTLFGSGIEDGNYHFAKNREGSDEFIETALNIGSFVSMDEGSLMIRLPLNLSKSLSRLLVNEIEGRIVKVPPSQVVEFVVNFKGFLEESHPEVEGFVLLFELFLESYFPNEFFRKGREGVIKDSSEYISWVCEANVTEAIKKGGAQETETVADQESLGAKHCCLLTDTGLMTKFKSLEGFLDQYKQPNETLLLENEEWNTSHFYFSTIGRCYYFNNRDISWYPEFVNTNEHWNMQEDEEIVSAMKINESPSAESVVQCTARGVIKKSSLNFFKNFRAGGMISMIIDEGDQLRHSVEAKDDDHILLLTQKGKGLRFSCNQLRNQGRGTRGVCGIRLKSGDQVVGMFRVDDTKLLLLIGKNGLAIKTKASCFLPNGGSGESSSPRSRGGQGVTAMNTDELCGAVQVEAESQILVVTEKGKYSVVPTQNIMETNRGSEGVKILDLDHEDSVQAVFTLT